MKLVAALLVGLLAAGRALASTDVPPALKNVGIDQRLGQEVPLDIPFVDESGQPVKLGDYLGQKPIVLVPAYYECPMLCTLVLNGMVSALKALSFDVGKEFQVVTFSFDPNETPEQAAKKKASYIKDYGRPGAAEGWHFLTGSADSITRLTKAIGYRYEYLADQKQYAHAAGIVVLTPKGVISRYFYGVEFSTRDIRFGLIESAQEHIGSAVDQLLLYCYHYDPLTGQYGAFTINLVRVAGLITVLAMVSFIVVMLRRERKVAAVFPGPQPLAHNPRT